MGDDRERNWATSVLACATFHELRDSADEIAALMVDPAPLPSLGGSSVMLIYRLLQLERQTSERLRSTLRRMLSD